MLNAIGLSVEMLRERWMAAMERNALRLQLAGFCPTEAQAQGPLTTVSPTLEQPGATVPNGSGRNGRQGRLLPTVAAGRSTVGEATVYCQPGKRADGKILPRAQRDFFTVRFTV